MKPLVITNSITRRDQKSLDNYLADIAKYNVLTPEQELEMFKQYKTGDKTFIGHAYAKGDKYPRVVFRFRVEISHVFGRSRRATRSFGGKSAANKGQKS